MRIRILRLLNLTLALVLAGSGPTFATPEVCTLPSASCGGGSISVAVDFANCNGGVSCAGGCALPGVQLQGQATVNIPGSCGGNRTVRVCQYWIKLPSTVQGSRCDPATLAPGSATAFNLNTNISSTGSYQYRIFVNDITTLSGCNNCSNDCDPAVGCGTMCEDQPASDGSCSVTI
jgi:hypothetical protein